MPYFYIQKLHIMTEILKERHQIKEKAKPYERFYNNADTVAILIHGFTGTPYDMRELADFLFENGADVMVVRLAGHGSHIEDLSRASYHDWYSSVREVVDRVPAAKRIFLIGYSFGSNIALDMAGKEPGLFKGVVCLGPSVYWHGRLYFAFLYPIFRLFKISKVRKPYVPKYQVEQWESTGNYAYFPTFGFREFRKFVTHETKKNLHKVITPTLIIHSRGDSISHPTSSEYVFEHIASSYKEMFLLPDLNHNPLSSENKNKIFKRVLQFVQS